MKYLFRSRLPENQSFLVKHRNTYAPTSTDHHDYHPHYEVYFCNDYIDQNITINGTTVTMHTPNIIISAPFSIHSMLPTDPEQTRFERYVLFFNDAMFTMLDNSLFSQEFFSNYSNCIFPLTAESAKEFSSMFDYMLSPNVTPAEQKLLFALFINTLARRVPTDERVLYGMTNHYIVEVLQYIYRHLTEELTSQSISEAFHISRAKLDRDFRRFVGQSIHQALMNCRLTRATDLLAGTRIPVKQVAELCGFDNEYYFYSFFKRNTGKTPLAFRKNYDETK